MNDLKDALWSLAGRSTTDKYKGAIIKMRVTQAKSSENPDATSEIECPVKLREDPGSGMATKHLKVPAKNSPEDDPDTRLDTDVYGQQASTNERQQNKGGR